MNLIERLERMANFSDSEEIEAIETVRAMQEALRSLYARCQVELADPEDVPEMHEAFAALRRAGGES